jgi:DNA helicase II / ATP-dependent DNA helicase PcrA
LIREARYPLQKGSSNYWMGGSKPKELPWEQTYCPLAEAGDMVLCRVNAPLVGQCFRFIKRKIPANILGRNIGDGLVGLVDKSKMHTTERLIGWMDDWLTKEMAQESAKRHPSEHRIIALQDRHDCILCFAEDTTTVDEVKAKISEVFVDKRCPKCKRNYAELSAKNCSNPACNGAVLELPNGIRLSSIHKSKGLEAKRVFLLEPEGATVPHPMAKSAWQYQQELNLRYVAITRAREELVYVS